MRIDLSSSGDSLKVLANTANENTFIDALHEAIHKVSPGGLGTEQGETICAFMNEGTYLGVGKTLRRLALLDTTKDQYDRTWSMFMGAKLVDVGLKDDQSTEIITATEDPGDAGNDATSIYVARFSGDDGLHVIQLNNTSPEPYDPTNGGELETAPAFIRRIDWGVGLENMSKFSLARIFGFKMAAA